MPIDNYEEIKRRLHEGDLDYGHGQLRGTPTKDIEAAQKQAKAQAEAESLVSRYSPDVLKLASAMLSQPAIPTNGPLQ